MTDSKQRPRILAIDDTPANLLALGASLREDFDLQFANSGAVGMVLAVDMAPDLILLDVMMPQMDGYETCRRLKADARLRNIPVIFLTALGESQAEAAGLALGAADYITKPINLVIARQRISNLLEREGLRKEVEGQRDQLQHSSELLMLARQRELDIGRSIQRSLLQSEVPEGIDGACFASFSEPSQGVDGDFYEIRRLHANCFEVLVGDVMGKGVPAALIGAAIRTTYHQVLADLLITGVSKAALPTPQQIVGQLHHVLTPRLTELASFATLALYRFDLATGTLSYVNAGHTPGLLLRAQARQAVAVQGVNLPIGVLPGEIYSQTDIPIGPGDCLLVFSDGITDAHSAGGEEFGMQRLSTLLAAWPSGDSCSCQRRLDQIRQALHQFSGSVELVDDQTAMMIQLTENSDRGEPLT
jgi:serine phosphatase RsbU (regulator of sigma subunit)